MIFKIINNEKEIECNILFTFKDEGNNISYIVYTDGTLDEEGNKEIYASRYNIKNNQYILEEIKNDSEWDLIDNMIEAKYREMEK